MFIKKVIQYFNTIKYLKYEQFVYRLWYFLLKLFYPERNIIKYNPPNPLIWQYLKPTSRFQRYSWVSANEISQKRFKFLNHTINFDLKNFWNNSECDRLWLYNLHYFQFLLSDRKLDPVVAVFYIHDWIAKNPPGTFNAWDPYPSSLRIVNLIKYLSTERINNDLKVIIHSLYIQTIWLEKQLEFHLLGNHLIKNAKALVFAGLFFKGKDGQRWLNKGIKILSSEFREQILNDGGHFERSPMYHAMILEDCLDLINITHNNPGSKLENLKAELEIAADRMIGYLNGMCHPDGKIALFNDAAFGIEHTPKDIFQYYNDVTGKRVSPKDDKFWSLHDTGYYVMAPDTDDRMVIDCGHVGPDYQPGHSHCDTLSFELSLKGRRVIVDSGCFQYEDGPIRQYNRSNDGHNTVTVDGENQSEVWGAHRCARRAQPIYAKLKELEDGSLHFKGAHNGYKRLKGHPIHQRSIIWKANKIFIDDLIKGTGLHDIGSRLHIHPDLRVEDTRQGLQVSEDNQLLMTVMAEGKGIIDIEKGWYCPEFGLQLECKVLKLKYNNVSLPFECGWRFTIK